MRLAEIRELDGPNIFLAEPAVKIELAFDSEGDLAWTRDRAKTRLASNHIDHPLPKDGIEDVLRSALAWLSTSIGQPTPLSAWKTLDTRGHVVFAFGWNTHGAAQYISSSLIDLLAGDSDEAWPPPSFAQSENSGAPLWVRDDERRAKIVAITGTNGKTTTTRLVAHLAMNAGLHAGWSSSSGVYIDGEEVLSGDYSGPSGARRVLEEPIVDVAVLESARGGILLRGLAFESSEVSIFTNVSSDHLGLQGINTIESLANVKATVSRSTRLGGVAVLNADDKQVMRSTAAIRAEKMLISQNEENPLVVQHLAGGGRALVAAGGQFVLCSGSQRTQLLAISEAPVTYGGRARHMIENALCAAAAGIGLGLTNDQVIEGLRSFRNTPEQNLGRLNLFTVNEATVVLDFAHNPAGLDYLLTFARLLTKPGAKVWAIIGTAGDRESAVLRDIGRIAGAKSDQVVIKNTEHYLRGRTNEEMIQLFDEGVRTNANAPATIKAPSELEAMNFAIDQAEPGDAIAMMCQEQIPEVLARLNEIGTPL